jgi:hypothetical protein
LHNARVTSLDRICCALVLSLWAALALADYDAMPKRPIDLTGSWVLNTASSDDPEAMLAQRQAKEREQYERARRRVEASQPPGMLPPIDAHAPRRELRPWQKRHQENLRRMLAVSATLEIKELEPTRLEFISEVEVRRVQAGSHTQVSMPEGQLADSWVGWDGAWFVIERRVRRGPRVIEKFRLTKNGQLEYFMHWSGEGELAGMKIRRFFDRRTGPAPAPNPDHGPLP